MTKKGLDLNIAYISKALGLPYRIDLYSDGAESFTDIFGSIAREMDIHGKRENKVTMVMDTEDWRSCVDEFLRFMRVGEIEHLPYNKGGLCGVIVQFYGYFFTILKVGHYEEVTRLIPFFEPAKTTLINQ